MQGPAGHCQIRENPARLHDAGVHRSRAPPTETPAQPIAKLPAARWRWRGLRLSARRDGRGNPSARDLAARVTRVIQTPFAPTATDEGSI